MTMFTLREAYAKKIMTVYLAIASILLTGFGIVLIFVDFSGLFKSSPGINMTANAAQLQVTGFNMFRGLFTGAVFSLNIFFSIFATSSFVTSMLVKGTIDLFISKPITRYQLLLGKYFGGVLVVLINVSYMILMLYFFIGLKFGIWETNFLFSILIITLAFSVLYALMVLLEIAFRGQVAALIITYAIYMILSPVLSQKSLLTQIIHNSFINNIITSLYYIIPKTSEMSFINISIAAGSPVVSWQPLWSSALFGIAALGSALYIFQKKDY